MNIRTILLRTYWLLNAQFGIDPRKTLQSLQGLPRYVRDLFRFRSSYTGRLELMPCLHDWYEGGGTTKNEYFWQDLLVAKKIFAAKPERHVDIGSRVDGFVAHVASFREIEVFDIRPLSVKIPSVFFKEKDLINPDGLVSDYCDSLSCLHALEHFGLGRYGDKLDTKGFETGLRNMVSMLSRGGTFYLSVPVGIERVEFNGQRVVDPRTVIALAAQNQLFLKEFAWVGREGILIASLEPEKDFKSLSEQPYALGIFTFRKT